MGAMLARFEALGEEWRREDEAAGKYGPARAIQVLSAVAQAAESVGRLMSVMGPERASTYFRLVSEAMGIAAAEIAAAESSSPSSAS